MNDLRLIDKLKLREYDGIFKYLDSQILYSVRKGDDGFYYYCFLNTDDMATQVKTYVNNCISKKDFKNSNFKQKINRAGTIVFRTNKALDKESLYETYDNRWIEENAFDFYKNILDDDKERVQGQTRNRGTEFINYISLIISTKAWNSIRKVIEKKYSFNQVIDRLKGIQAYVDRNSNLIERKRITVKLSEDVADAIGLFN